MNKKNGFNLQKLLDVRELVEKEKQKELSLSKRKLKTEQENLLRLLSTKNQAALKIQGLERGEVSRFATHNSYLSSLQETISNKQQLIANIEQEIEEKRQKLLEAAKNRKALDKLKEKHAHERLLAENKVEQNIMDEIAIRKASKA